MAKGNVIAAIGGSFGKAPGNLQETVDGNLILNFGGKCRYDLSKDIAYCEAEWQQENEVNRKWGSTLAQVLLFGAGAALFQKRHAFLGGTSVGIAGQLSTHEETQNEFVAISIYLFDGKYCEGKCSEGLAEMLLEVAIFDDAKEFSRWELMKQDAARVIPELQSELMGYKADYEELAEISNNGETFEQRQNASEEAQQLYNVMYKRYVLLKHLEGVGKEDDDKRTAYYLPHYLKGWIHFCTALLLIWVGFVSGAVLVTVLACGYLGLVLTWFPLWKKTQQSERDKSAQQ